jgi:hypothetical protein
LANPAFLDLAWHSVSLRCKVPIDQTQLPGDASTLRRMGSNRSRNWTSKKRALIKTENPLRQLLAAGSEQITEEQLTLFEAELKAQGKNIDDLLKPDGDGPDDKDPPTGNTKGEAAWPPSPACATDAGTHRARSGRSRETLQRLRAGFARVRQG